MGLPFFFMQMLGWAGERGAGAAIEQSGAATTSAKGAGSKGGSMVEGSITK
jgi:hypothetical protein